MFDNNQQGTSTALQIGSAAPLGCSLSYWGGSWEGPRAGVHSWLASPGGGGGAEVREEGEVLGLGGGR